MPLSLFTHEPKNHLMDSIGESGEFAHTFGGEGEEFDLEVKNAPLLPHLVYRIDLADPAIPIDRPGVEFLPLLYPFRYSDECSYLVHPENKVEMLGPIPTSHYPPWEAPESFPLTATKFEKQKYDPKVAEDTMRLKGVFGWDELSQTEKDRALELARDLTHLTEDDGIDESWDYETVIDCMYEPPFAQGDPLERCKNSACELSNPDVSQWMKTLAIQDDAVKSELIWPDEYVQTIWMSCSACGSITALNRCS